MSEFKRQAKPSAEARVVYLECLLGEVGDWARNPYIKGDGLKCGELVVDLFRLDRILADYHDSKRMQQLRDHIAELEEKLAYAEARLDEAGKRCETANCKRYPDTGPL